MAPVKGGKSRGSPGGGLSSAKRSDPSRKQSRSRRASHDAGHFSVPHSDGLSLKEKKRRAFVRRVVDSKTASIFIIMLSLYSLFGDGIRMVLYTKDADPGFDVVTGIIFVILCLEIGANCYAREDYFCFPTIAQLKMTKDTAFRTWIRRLSVGSFYFWLDLLGTFALVLEISPIYNAVALAPSNVAINNAQSIRSGYAYDQKSAYDERSRAGSLLMFVHLGFIIRAAARAGRIVRMYRQVETGKFKLQHSVDLLMGWKKEDEGDAAAAAAAKGTASARIKGGGPAGASMRNPKSLQDHEDAAKVQRSRVGAAMTELMNKRVVFLVILLYIIIELMTTTQYDRSMLLAVQLVHASLVNAVTAAATAGGSAGSGGYDVATLQAMSSLTASTPVLAVYINGAALMNNQAMIDKRRMQELTYLRESDGGVDVEMIFDTRYANQDREYWTLLTTFFVYWVLVLGTYFMTSDVNKLIINPIERLVDLVRKISANPLGVEYKMLGEKEGFKAGMETTILLTTINRIGGLMQVGFGEAGASMIAKNLGDSSGGRLNLMGSGSGSMIKSIFGFCDVRQFTDTTECLQEEVMLFVNRIAFILHDIVVQCSGAANKNIGDAFLLMWKLDDKMQEREVSFLADQALLAFIKTLIELQRYQKFIMNFSVAAMERLHKRFPNYEVRIGSGLHVGWAIEGAIGSNRKIDASYLSPHVNFTEFLESSTKEYGVPLLFSEPFYNLLSPHVKKYVRQVDNIRRSMGEDPVGLFIYDFDMAIDWGDDVHKTRRNFIAHLTERDRSPPGRPAGLHTQSSVLSGSRGPGQGGRRSSFEQITGVTTHQRGAGGPGGAQPRKASNFAPVQVSKRRGPNQDTDTSPLMDGHQSHQGSRKLSAIQHSASRNQGPNAARITQPLQMAHGKARSNNAFDDDDDDADETPEFFLPEYHYTTWDHDPDLVEARHLISDAFRQQWDKGIQAYIKGDWQKARDIFHETVNLPGTPHQDGPSKLLIHVIDEYGGAAPTHWKGYRMEEGGH